MATVMKPPAPTGPPDATPEHCSPRWPLLTACRPHQWVKNALVFAVPFLAGQVLVIHVALAAIGAAAVFVMASSATYLINDAGDAVADRRHPVKRHRPIAAGDLSIPSAHRAAASLLVVAGLAAAILGPGMLSITALYVLATTCYSRWLKQIPVVDVVVVATGFLFRAVAGGIATGIAISPLFLVAATGGALFIVIGKRLGEVTDLGASATTHRRVLAWYRPDRCTQMLGWSLGATVLAFTGWALTATAPGDASTLPLGGLTLISLAILPFLAAAERAWQLVQAGRGADPLKLLTHDRLLALCSLACGGLLAGALYL